ncbi:MAG: Na/Pi cotransporter family protein [Rhodocyclaceae bacterium]|nr:Na/Pi cotransporter family protein [Rhodocyclaceae bacterium]
MSAEEAGLILGGIGLFLLGMMLMTDGLKAAAGPLLGNVLASSTQTRLRGLASGLFVTMLVQSSSAVTIAAIGFVNAGLLTFGQSLWVIFGSNLGSTMTGWLVALIGFKLKVEAAALPLIGIGMCLHISGPNARRGALGQALAGFGLLFLGIAFLQQAFSDAGQFFDLGAWSGHGLRSIVGFVLAGLLLTVLMQSSAASMAVALTLAEAGALPLPEAAAAVIGSNVGTTATALIAAIGATPDAKRAASAHILFNVLTGIVAFVLLPVLIQAVALLGDAFDLGPSPAVSLALFHTIFNLLGVALMWPLGDRLAVFLKRRFRTREEEISRPRFLDRNVASVPSLAADALRRELVRVGGMAVGGVRARLGALTGAPGRPDESAALPALARAAADFVTRVHRGSMSADTAQFLAELLRVQRYYETCHEIAPDIATGHATVAALGDSPLRHDILGLTAFAETLLVRLDPENEAFAPPDEAQAEEFEARYQHLKTALLTAGACGEIDIPAMESLTRSFSTLRRVIDQAAKAARLLAAPRGGATPATAG